LPARGRQRRAGGAPLGHARRREPRAVAVGADCGGRPRHLSGRPRASLRLRDVRRPLRLHRRQRRDHPRPPRRDADSGVSRHLGDRRGRAARGPRAHVRTGRMSLYSRTDEERVRLQMRVADWVDANLLTRSQGDRLAGDLTTDLRRTNRLLRAALALFTVIVVVAAVALVVVATDLDQRPALAVVMALAAAISFVIACRFVMALRFYRHGVEEGLAICSVGLAGFSAYEATAVVLGHAGSSSDVML